MAKRKQTVLLDWSIGLSDWEYADPLFVIDKISEELWEPSMVAVKDKQTMKEIKAKLGLYTLRFNSDDWNFDYGGYDCDIDYIFKLKPFTKKMILDRVDEIYQSYEGQYCPDCHMWYRNDEKVCSECQ